MRRYFRPIVQTDSHRPDGAVTLAGGRAWFYEVEELSRDGSRGVRPARALPGEARQTLTARRPAVAGLTMDQPRLMGILNVTPDSFSDGGQFLAPEAALSHARRMVEDGADILDIGGESTRPGAQTVPVDVEINRTAPVITALRSGGLQTPISIDTRKAEVARSALASGANLINDVAAFSFDPGLAAVAAQAQAPVCLMHAQGTPEEMQSDPQYDDVLLDVYDFLEDRIAAAEVAGIPRGRIVIDPGVGFGKTLEHNLTLLKGLSLFHNLGCPILIGASRKRFIGTLGHAAKASQRVPGSVAVALEAARQGVQFLRVHDIRETRQGLALAQALWA